MRVPCVQDRRLCVGTTPANAPRLSANRAACRVALSDDAFATALAEAPLRPARTRWYEKPCPGWSELSDLSDFQRVTSRPDGRYKVVEFYAGWCHSCKGSFPALCKMAEDDVLNSQYEFYKANVEKPNIMWWLNHQNITGLPFVAVWSPTGQVLFRTPCSLKRVPQVKAGLRAILQHPDSKSFAFNPQGVLEPVSDNSNSS